MSSVWKRLQRVNKQAAKFQFTVSYHQLVLETTTNWTPNKVSVVWCRRSRRVATEPLPWEPTMKDPLKGMVIWPVPENKNISVTLFKDSRSAELEDKEWIFIIEDVNTLCKRRQLACYNINMKKYASVDSTQHNLQLHFKPLTKKIISVVLECTISSVFVREGKATDEDMLSMASLMGAPSNDIAVLEDFDEEEGNKLEDDNSCLHVVTGITNQLEMLTNSLSDTELSSTLIPDSSIKSLPKDDIAPTAVIRNFKDNFNTFQENKFAQTLKSEIYNKIDSRDKRNITENEDSREARENLEPFVLKNDHRSTGRKAASTPGQDLLQWCREITQNYPGVKVTNLTTSWRNGLAFCAIIHYFCQELIDFDSLTASDIRGNCKKAFDAGEKLGVPRVIEPADMEFVTVPDKLAVMTYLYQLRAYFTGHELEVQQIGKTADESSYLVGRYDTDSDTNLSVQLFGQEIRNLHKKQLNEKRNLKTPDKRPVDLSEDEVKLSEKQNFSSRIRNSVDYSDNERSPSSVKGFLTDKMRSGSKSILLKVLSPTKDKYAGVKEKAKSSSLVSYLRSEGEASLDKVDNKYRKTSQGSMARTPSSENQMTTKSLLGEINDEVSGPQSTREKQPCLQSRREELRERAKQLLENVKKNPNRLTSDSNTAQQKRQDEFRERARKLIGDVKKGANPSSLKGSGSSKLPIAECNYKINDVSSSCPLKELSCSNTTDTEGDSDNIHRRVPVTPLQSFTTLIERISSEKKMNTQLEVKSRTNYANHTNYIQNELAALEREQKAIDNEADMLEKYLRRIIKSGNDHEQEEILMTRWFTLVNKKNALLRRQMQLNILEKEDDLERRFDLLTRELRSVMNIEDRHKAEDQKLRENLLLNELLNIVNERDELVHHLDTQERAIEDDDEIEKDISRANLMDRNKNCAIQ